MKSAAVSGSTSKKSRCWPALLFPRSSGVAMRPRLHHKRVVPILVTTRKAPFHNYLKFRIPIPKGDNHMTTVLERETRTITQTGQGNRQGRCEGCPRCDEPASGFCKIPHPKYQNRHPVCKVCGHCVLRGNHMDDASDLDEHPGLGPEHAGQGPSLN